MQLISSLLALQRQDVHDSVADRLLDNAQNRIRSIPLVHEMLYDSDDFGSMDFGGCAAALAREILQGDGGEGIGIELDIRSISISMNEAVPCRLILNEALTNMRKHAFPSGWQGKPIVELSLARRRQRGPYSPRQRRRPASWRRPGGEPHARPDDHAAARHSGRRRAERALGSRHNRRIDFRRDVGSRGANPSQGFALAFRPP